MDWNFRLLETFLLVHRKFTKAFPDLAPEMILKLMDPHGRIALNLDIPNNCIHCGLTPGQVKEKKEEKQYQWEHICESITDRMKKYGITHDPTIKAAVYLLQTNKAGYFTIPYIKQTLKLPEPSDDESNSLVDDLPSYQQDEGRKQQSMEEQSIGSLSSIIIDGSQVVNSQGHPFSLDESVQDDGSLLSQDDGTDNISQDNISQDFLNDLLTLPSISRQNTNDSQNSLILQNSQHDSGSSLF